MGPLAVLAVAMPMIGSAEALAALGASLRVRRDATAVSPQLAESLDAVLVALGILDAVDALGEQELTALLGVVEGFLAQASDFVVEPGRAGWDHEQPSILLAQGHTSTLLAGVFRDFVVPALGGDLAQRLQAPGASFLDVGAGVAALSVAMCRVWPQLRVVGIDPWEPALALAREHVAAAGLEQRIELRAVTAEQLDDSAEHDLAWVPTFFVTAEALDCAIGRVHDALLPGGCVILGLYVRPPEPLAAAIADLRTVRQGGALHTPQESAQLLKRAGFDDVGVHHDATTKGPVLFVCGRRPAP